MQPFLPLLSASLAPKEGHVHSLVIAHFLVIPLQSFTLLLLLFLLTGCIDHWSTCAFQQRKLLAGARQWCFNIHQEKGHISLKRWRCY